MKSTIFLFIFLSIQAFADIEAPGDTTKATVEEITASRSCFAEVVQAGCKHPSENQVEFRSCIGHVFPSLSSSCQEMMNQLYNVR
jgi:hypothetical protein